MEASKKMVKTEATIVHTEDELPTKKGTIAVAAKKMQQSMLML